VWGNVREDFDANSLPLLRPYDNFSCFPLPTDLLYVDFLPINVTSCECHSLFSVLARHGLFPTAPSKPRMTISTDLLDFYRALFERSCDAVNAMASALNTFYIRRGFRLLNKQVRNVMVSCSFAGVKGSDRVISSSSLFVEGLVTPFSGTTVSRRRSRGGSIRRLKPVTTFTSRMCALILLLQILTNPP
jgi:hypothetical protein